MTFKRWLPNVLPALVVAVIITTFPPRAVAQACVPIEAMADLIGQLPTFRILEGDRLLRAVALFNSTPPEATDEWPSAYFAIRPDGFGVLMFGGVGTICTGMVIPPAGVFEVLRIIDGVSA